MALMTMEREPEVARFIDTYKFDQDMATRRDRYGGGTSLPLNSDGYEDKQKVLRDERHKDWLQQQDKPRSRDAVYYRVGTPEEGFAGLGNYEKQRQEINMVRQKEYNDMLKKQRQMEQQKLDARRHRSPPRPAQPLGPQIDYNAASENARAEERRAYQDYMGKYQYPTNGPVKPPIDYEENKKVLNEERKREYNQMMEKKAKEERYWAMRGRPVTPPGGLNIGNYDRQVKETAAAKKKEYKEMLDQQQREHMYLRARQEPEISILDRNGPSSNFLANKPPPGPGFSRARDEAFKTNSHPSQPPPRLDQPYSGPNYSQEGHKYENGPEGLFERPDKSQERPRSKRSLDVDRNYSQSKPEKITMSGNQLSPRRTKNQFYKDSEEADERRRQEDIRHQQQQMSKPTEIVKNPFYSSDDYEKFQREIQRKQGEEYREFLSKKSTEVRNRDWNFEQNGVLELRGDDAVQSKQRELKAERQREYNNYMSQQRVSNPSRRHEFVDTASGPYGGLFHGLGEHGNRTEVLNRERHQEYNEKLDQQFGKDRPSGRPNWVKESLPNDVDRGRSPMRNQPDQYQQILDEKRREEASRRRYEDPEYQGRLAQGRDRGEAGQRYGY